MHHSVKSVLSSLRCFGLNVSSKAAIWCQKAKTYELATRCLPAQAGPRLPAGCQPWQMQKERRILYQHTAAQPLHTTRVKPGCQLQPGQGEKMGAHGIQRNGGHQRQSEEVAACKVKSGFGLSQCCCLREACKGNSFQACSRCVHRKYFPLPAQRCDALTGQGKREPM